MLSISPELNKDKNIDKETLATTIALSLKIARQDDAKDFLPYILSNVGNLINYGIDPNEVEEVFFSENFDVHFPVAIATLKGIFGDELSLNSIKFFTTRYCKTKEDLSDATRIPILATIYKQIDANDVYELDKFYQLTLDENGEYNSDKSEFISNSICTLLDTCKNEKNSLALVVSRKEDAMNMISSSLKAIILSNEAQYGTFDKDKAEESLACWLNYITNNKEMLNDMLKVNVNMIHSQTKKELTIREVTKNYPNYSEFFDNTFYKLYNLLANINGKTN